MKSLLNAFIFFNLVSLSISFEINPIFYGEMDIEDRGGLNNFLSPTRN